MLCGISDKFSWQRIWDLSKQFQLWEYSTLQWKCIISKTRLFVPYIEHILVIISHNLCFLTFSDLVQAPDALRDLGKIFLAKNLRLVKTISALRIQYSSMKVHNIQNTFIGVIYWAYSSHYITLFVLFDFQRFSLCTRCSAGSRKIFLCKESETCQNNFSSENIVLFHESA